MIMNAMRGSLKIAGIKAPFYGEERRNLLSDLAIHGCYVYHPRVRDSYKRPLSLS